ncbi:hypothetical protein DFH06DRAFT_1125081 [Mycena polygramma]|nr:hypothetical protein DFH06DRAFT_1125081 [Mycena polygramma]
MAPSEWATPDQKALLFSWMPDFIRRQAERKLHLFWAAMQLAWFTENPEQAALGLPLPSDPNARALTPDELAILGAAIMSRKKKLENWFRYQRKKIRTAEAGTVSATTATSAMIRSLFNINTKSTRAHQHIELFQLRNVDLINKVLTLAGTAAAFAKSKKTELMRLRTRVIAGLWKAASPEEKAAIEEEIEREKEELRQKELEDENKEKTPEQLQDGIDVSETVFSEVQKAAFKGSNWVSMTIIGGPNPRMGGELSLKIISYGSTPAGNDFEDSCVNFDKNVVESFEGFMRQVYTAEQRRSSALPARPTATATDAPRAARVMAVPAPPPTAPAAAAKPKKTASKKKKKASAVAPGTASAAAPATAPAAPATPSASLESPNQSIWDESENTDMDETSASSSLDSSLVSTPSATPGGTLDDFSSLCHPDAGDNDVFGFEPDAGSDNDVFGSALDIEDGSGVQRWPPGMTAPLSPAAAAALALVERGGVRGGGPGPTLAMEPRVEHSAFVIDPQLENESIPASPTPAALVRPKPRPTFRGAVVPVVSEPATPIATSEVNGFNFPVMSTSPTLHTSDALSSSTPKPPATTSASASASPPALHAPSPYQRTELFQAFQRTPSSMHPGLPDTQKTGLFLPPIQSCPPFGMPDTKTRYLFGAPIQSRSPIVQSGPTKAAQTLSAILALDARPAPALAPPTPALPAPTPALPAPKPALPAPTPIPAPALPVPTVAPAAPAVDVPRSRPQGNPVPVAKAPSKKGAKAGGKKKVAMAKADEREAAAGMAETAETVAKRSRGRPRKPVPVPLAETTNAPPPPNSDAVAAEAAPAAPAALDEKAGLEKEAADATARQAAKGWIDTTKGGGPTTVVFTRARRPPKPITFADGTVPKVNKHSATEAALLACMAPQTVKAAGKRKATTQAAGKVVKKHKA